MLFEYVRSGERAICSDDTLWEMHFEKRTYAKLVFAADWAELGLITRIG